MSDLGNKEIMAKNIQHFMDIKKIERSDLSTAIGVPYTTISDWLNAKTYPRIDKIEKMANYFGVNKRDLVEMPDENILPYTRGRSIPIIGSIPAGVPVLAVENIDGYDYANVPQDGEYFYLRVRGNSMVNARIYDGDLVLVESQNYADNGEIVVCLINGDEATLKRFNRQGDIIILQPENSDYHPILVPCKDFNSGYARIIGVAREVKHKL